MTTSLKRGTSATDTRHSCRLLNCPLAVDFSLNHCYITLMTYTREQLINALQHEYEFLIHDDYDPDTDMSASEHLSYISSLNVEQLIDATDCDAEFTLDMFMASHGWCLPWGDLSLQCRLLCLLVHFTHSHLLTTLSTIARSLQCGEVLAPFRSSSCVDYIVCNLFSGYVRVSFNDMRTYEYNARKRDILKLLTDKTISYGFFVNNCLNLDNPINRYSLAAIWCLHWEYSYSLCSLHKLHFIHLILNSNVLHSFHSQRCSILYGF